MSREGMLLDLAAVRRKIGNTPCLVLNYPGHATIMAKLEYLNFSGSIKDRPAINLVENVLRALPEDALTGVNLLDYSGGNMGISLARICKILDWKFHLATVRNCPEDFKSFMEGLGARVYVAKGDGFWSAMELANEIKAAYPGHVFLNQTYNEVNFNAHYQETAVEIISALVNHVPAAWVASVGSGGTFSGVFERLSQTYPALHGHVVSPAEQPFGDKGPANDLPKFQGSGGLGAGRKQPFIAACEDRVSQFWSCSYDDALIEARNFMAERGVAIGSSAGANLRVAKALAKNIGTGGNRAVVTVFPSLATVAEKKRMLGLSL